MLVHNSRNELQNSVRMLDAIAAIFCFRIWSQDVSQAYLERADKLFRNVYVLSPEEFQLRSDQLLKLLNLLYGLSDSADYWHKTFVRHITRDLSMKLSTSDL